MIKQLADGLTREQQRNRAGAYFQHARDDAYAANVLAKDGRTRAQALFCVQQATEKFWKSTAYAVGVNPPRNHMTLGTVESQIKNFIVPMCEEFYNQFIELYELPYEEGGLASHPVFAIASRISGEEVMEEVKGHMKEMTGRVNDIDDIVSVQIEQIHKHASEVRNWTPAQIRFWVDTALRTEIDIDRFAKLFGMDELVNALLPRLPDHVNEVFTAAKVAEGLRKLGEGNTSRVHQIDRRRRAERQRDDVKVPLFVRLLIHIDCLRTERRRKKVIKLPLFVRLLIRIHPGYRRYFKELRALLNLVVIGAVTWPHAIAARYPDSYGEDYITDNSEIGAIEDVAYLAEQTNASLEILAHRWIEALTYWRDTMRSRGRDASV